MSIRPAKIIGNLLKPKRKWVGLPAGWGGRAKCFGGTAEAGEIPANTARPAPPGGLLFPGRRV
jgi:hypothetical protein